jgi:hypothetical protein
VLSRASPASVLSEMVSAIEVGFPLD